MSFSILCHPLCHTGTSSAQCWAGKDGPLLWLQHRPLGSQDLLSGPKYHGGGLMVKRIRKTHWWRFLSCYWKLQVLSPLYLHSKADKPRNLKFCLNPCSPFTTVNLDIRLKWQRLPIQLWIQWGCSIWTAPFGSTRYHTNKPGQVWNVALKLSVIQQARAVWGYYVPVHFY